MCGNAVVKVTCHDIKIIISNASSFIKSRTESGTCLKYLILLNRSDLPVALPTVLCHKFLQTWTTPSTARKNTYTFLT